MVDEPEVEPQSGEPEIEPYAQPIIGSSVGAIGLVGYGDDSEYSGPPVVIVYTPPYGPFLATDARSVMITLMPQHYNLIPNPAFRVNAAGWVVTGLEPAANAFSWRVANALTITNLGLAAIINKTMQAAVDPDPSTSPPYVNGQLVKIVDNLTLNNTVAWLKIAIGTTLTVAQGTAVGIKLNSDAPGYKVYDPLTDGSLDADSWVGQSLVANGTGMLRYRAGTNKFVYVGPLAGTQENQWDFKRGGDEYTFSIYAKGEGEIRLTMDAYNAIDATDLSSGPEYQNLISVAAPATYPKGESAVIETSTGYVWTAITDPPIPTVAPFYQSIDRGPALASAVGEWTPVDNDGVADNDMEWHRHIVKTRARVYENAGEVAFGGANWIDTKIEVRNANNLRISAIMLDPIEYPVAQYFDGGMTENLNLDDFIWEGSADASPSYYYYDRVVRTRWLYERMGYVLPAGRPFQIFFGSYWRPYVGKTGETIIMIPA